MPEFVLAVALLAVLGTLGVVVWLALRLPGGAEKKHREMLTALHDGLTRQGDRLGAQLGDLREAVAAKLDARLDQISLRVNERLDEGFRKTNETFVSVMQRLATIDEAQKKIEGLPASGGGPPDSLGEQGATG